MPDWLTIQARLRATRMTMDEMQQFARRVHATLSPDIIAARLATLRDHNLCLARRRADPERIAYDPSDDRNAA
jgi:hypothetical protein